MPFETPSSVLILNANSVNANDLNHTADELTYFALMGDNYAVSGDSILLSENYFGPLSFDVVVQDPSGAADTLAFSLEVTPVNDAPEILSYQGESTFDVNSTFTLSLGDFVVEDPDNASADLILTILEGEHYQFDGTNITPDRAFEGDIVVNVGVNDGTDTSEAFEVTLTIETILSTDFSALTDVKFYPNPAQDFVHIDVGGLKGEELQLNFYTLAGTLLQTNQLENKGSQPVTVPLKFASQVVLVVMENETGQFGKTLLRVK